MSHVAIPGKSEKNEIHTLPTLVAIACATVLEAAVDELGILGKIGNLPNIIPSFTYKSPEERFDSYVAEVQLFDPDTIEPYEESLRKAKFIKFQTDRAYVEKILTDTIASLANDNNYTCLQTHINQYNSNLEVENGILQVKAKNEKIFKDLENLLQQERQEGLAEIQRLSETVGTLKDEIEDLGIENKIKLDYVKHWEESRFDQNDIQLDYTEAEFTKVVNNVKSDIEKEVRISAEIETFILEIQQDYTQQIQSWMERYDYEIEFRDTELQLLKEKREEQFNRLQALSQLFEKHKDEIDEYLAIKENRRLEEELRQKQLRMIIKIQAWWRGVMVRRHLGRFKVSKKKNEKIPGKSSSKKKK